MQEEFHGVWSGTATTAWQQKYGWNSITANVWLPSLSELVGITGTVHPNAGTYYSAMQGLNTSIDHWTDTQGGTQFTYFQQFNASGGGAAIMSVCKQETAWLRSTSLWTMTTVWRTTNTQRIDTMEVTGSYAVHPAVLYNPERLVKQSVVCLLKTGKPLLFFLNSG